MSKIYYCETPDGYFSHVPANRAIEAAEDFVQYLARDGDARPGEPTYVRVTYSNGRDDETAHFEVEVEMVPDATAKPCDGDELGFDAPSAVVR